MTVKLRYMGECKEWHLYCDRCGVYLSYIIQDPAEMAYGAPRQICNVCNNLELYQASREECEHCNGSGKNPCYDPEVGNIEYCLYCGELGWRWTW